MPGRFNQQQARRRLNDQFRRNCLTGGIVALTEGVATLPFAVSNDILKHIQRFDNFSHAIDPEQEHAQGRFKQDGMTVKFNIICLSPDFRSISEHPEDPQQTIRVLTVHLDHEFNPSPKEQAIDLHQ